MNGAKGTIKESAKQLRKQGESGTLLGGPVSGAASAYRILGIDPGLQVTGYAILETQPTGPRVLEAGVLRMESTSMTDRLRTLHQGVVEVIEQFQPQVMVVEQLFAHYAHPRTAILMGHARGVILLAAGLKGIPAQSYGATQIKKTIAGSGRALKEQMQRTIQRELGLPALPEPPDVADALAVALCHYHQQKLPLAR